MVDVKSFLSALKIGRLTCILCDNGKITKILQKMCPSIQNIKKCGWKFANVIMQKVKKKKNCGKMYLNITNKLYGKCIPATLDNFASECVCYNVNIHRGKRVIFIKGLTVVLFQLANPWDI